LLSKSNSENYHIYETARSELPKLLDINNAAVPAVNFLDLYQLEDLYAKSRYFFSVSVKTELAGFVVALRDNSSYRSVNYRWFNTRYSRFLYIDRIIIVPQFQHCGIGHLLYNCLTQAEQNYSEMLLCEVNLRPKNTPSLRFHEKYGFQQVGAQTTEDGAKEVAMLGYRIHN
tara:strand:- start:994 stop:1509 length:516 start_codon:yes stop_codon:yes gene_type:complete